MDPEDFTKWEFKLLKDDIQNTLNQWRHLYYLRILKMSFADDYLYLLIARRLKNE